MFVPFNVRTEDVLVSLVKLPAPLITPVCRVWFVLDKYLNIAPDPIAILPS